MERLRVISANQEVAGPRFAILACYFLQSDCIYLLQANHR